MHWLQFRKPSRKRLAPPPKVEAVVEKTPEVEAPVEVKIPEAKAPEPKAPETKAEVISSPASEEVDSNSFVDMSSGKTKAATLVAAHAANDVVEEQSTPETETAETVSEVPAQSSKSSTQDNEAMASNEAEKFKGALMSSNTDQIVNEAFEELRRATMEDIDEKTESMLRPMLSEWLDNNLPTLVERLVREEIERVSGAR